MTEQTQPPPGGTPTPPAPEAPHARPEGRPEAAVRRDRGRGRDGARRFYRRRKVCKFCVERMDSIDYKDVKVIGQFAGERGKILPRRLTGVCSPHQRQLRLAIKRARNIALLPFATLPV